MSEKLAQFLSVSLKAGMVLFVLNEVRGFILAVPVIYALYLSGGTLMAWWLAFCSLAGIAISVFVPVAASRWLQARFARVATQ